MQTTGYAHIELISDGRLSIDGTRHELSQIAIDRTVLGWDAEQIQRQYPDLTLGQIYSALAYYDDHQAEIDREIEDDERLVDALQAGAGASPLQAKLRAMARLWDASRPA